jgi:hypothetical protein
VDFHQCRNARTGVGYLRADRVSCNLARNGNSESRYSTFMESLPRNIPVNCRKIHYHILRLSEFLFWFVIFRAKL